MSATIDSFASLAELAGSLARREFTSVELAEHYLERINSNNGRLHAFVSVDRDGALQAANDADRRRAVGRSLGVLDGLPVALKDLFEIEGQVTTCGSAAWRNRRSAGTAAVAERLCGAGMVLLGKTHMVEFAFGLWGSNPLMGTPWNPWDLKRHRIPGGSSSGAAVAVAAGLAPAAIGSDTGGSVRIPASLTGITGLKTTSGLISMHNALPLSRTLDTVGPMCRTVFDAAWLTSALTRDDARGAKILDTAALWDNADATALVKNLSGVRIIALHERDFSTPVHADVSDVFHEARRVLQILGAQVDECAFPFDLADLARKNGRITAAEAWSVHREYIEDPSLEIGPAVRARVISGRSISDSEYETDRADQRRQSAIWRDWLSSADALLTPTLPIVACPLESIDEQSISLGTFVRAANYLGACALSIPAGFSADGLPIGVQLIAKPFDEAILVRVGQAIQRTTDWHRRTPAAP